MTRRRAIAPAPKCRDKALSRPGRHVLGMKPSDRSLNDWFRHQIASGSWTVSEMPPRSSGVDLAWQYGPGCLAKDPIGGV